MTPPTYRIVIGDGRSTEALMAAGDYGYVHSALISENFPVRAAVDPKPREIVLLEFDHEVTSGAAQAEAARLGLAPPLYEDAFHFGIAHPDVQAERPIVFLHDPWLGYFGRRDVVCLWTNAGRREIGLEDFDGRWAPGTRLAFVKRD
jgi:hypothetical protein